MQVLYERCAAVDVGMDAVAVAVRRRGRRRDGRVTDKRTYKTFYGVLREMAGWLASEGVTHVARGSTGSYSMPVCHALLEHGGFERVLVCNARHVKNVPGRKTDLADAEWLARLLECGLMTGSFVPPADIKAARDVIRCRKKIARQRVSEVSRLGDVLQDAGIKIDSVASSVAAKPGIAMIESLIDGERRGAVLAELAMGKMRSKIPDLSMALEGRFGDHHAVMCRLHLGSHPPPLLRETPPREQAPAARPCRVRLGRRPPRGLPQVSLPPARDAQGGYRSRAARNEAIITVAHAILVIIWNVLSTGNPCEELGPGYFDRGTGPERETRRLIARLEALGHTVSLAA